jgi:hypothetical protein
VNATENVRGEAGLDSVRTNFLLKLHTTPKYYNSSRGHTFYLFMLSFLSILAGCLASVCVCLLRCGLSIGDNRRIEQGAADVYSQIGEDSSLIFDYYKASFNFSLGLFGSLIRWMFDLTFEIIPAPQKIDVVLDLSYSFQVGLHQFTV